MPNPGGTRKRIVSLLKTGPLSWEQLMYAVGQAIPPGEAWRKFVTSREREAARKGRSLPVRPQPGDTEAIASGRRVIVAAALGHAHREGIIAYDGEGTNSEPRMVRLNSCPCCGRSY